MSTLITELTGVSSALTYAPWATLFFNLLFLGGLLLIYRSLTLDMRLVWLSTWFFFMSNWVGQDYFSPQSLGYFFFLVLIGILLRWFRPVQTPTATALHIRPLARFTNRLYEHADGVAGAQPSLAGQRLLLMALAVLLMAVMVFSH